MNTDTDWEKHAQEDPYWSVVTRDKFKGDIQNNSELLEEFFQTGRDHVSAIFNIINESVSKNFNPRTALDFGCGVGRIVVPLAERGLQVSGIDISETMIAITKKNLLTKGLAPKTISSEIALLPNGDKFDLIHTFIVLQHIPSCHGIDIIKSLIQRLSDDGVLVLHITYSPDSSHISSLRTSAKNFIRRVISSNQTLKTLVKKTVKRSISPPMLMEDYDLKKVFHLLQKHSLNNIHIRHSEHSGHLGLLLFAQHSRQVSHPGTF